jgi:hypothetical protein
MLRDRLNALRDAARVMTRPFYAARLLREQTRLMNQLRTICTQQAAELLVLRTVCDASGLNVKVKATRFEDLTDAEIIGDGTVN